MKPCVCLVVSSPMTLRAFLAPHVAAMRERYAVTVVANTAGAEWRPAGLDIEVVAVPIERRVAPLRDLAALVRLRRLFRQSRFELVLSVTPKAGLLAQVAARLARVPARLHIFTGQVWATQRGPARWLLKRMDRILVDCASHILVDSPSQREFLVAQGVVSADKSRVLGKGSISGVDGSRFRPDAEMRQAVRERERLDRDAVVFLYVGRLARDKGMRELAAAFTRLRNAGHDAQLLVVGPDEEGMRAAMEQELGEAAAHARFVKHTDRPQDYMAAADVFCLPSFREGFGVTVIEAAASGIPSIGSRIYGVTDAIVDGVTGLLCAPGDVEELARCMVRLASDAALRRTLGDRARERVLRDYREADVVAELQRFIDAIAGPARQAIR